MTAGLMDKYGAYTGRCCQCDKHFIGFKRQPFCYGCHAPEGMPAADRAAVVAAGQGFDALVNQQRREIEHVKATFDYSQFAGAQGPLSGPGACKGVWK